MTDLRTAAQQALEVLQVLAEGAEEECGEETCRDCQAWRPVWAAINALKAVLEQPEQEPVAWMYVGLTFNNDMHGPHLVWRPEHMDAMSAEKGVVASPLYTHPPRREWRGLTEEEISALFPSHLRGDYKDLIPYSFARAIEAALKERNA
jgi:hypothetical protein